MNEDEKHLVQEAQAGDETGKATSLEGDEVGNTLAFSGDAKESANGE